MKPFLEEVAKHIYQNYAPETGKCCIVFPNHRAGVFFTKHMGEIIDKPVWMPRLLTINELMCELSHLQVADTIFLTLSLYKIYNQVRKTNTSFDDFYPWGEILLNDFDDMDKYLVNSHDLFQNLSSIKEIEKKFSYLTEEQLTVIQNFWNSFDPLKYSQQQKDFIEIWAVLEEIYTRYRDYLKKQGLAYEGMMYREIAEYLTDGEPFEMPYLKLFFVGFNALNSCEEKLFTHLQQEEKAEFYWDYDVYYTRNNYHEAATFIKHNLKKFPSKLTGEVFNNFSTEAKHIESISTASNTGQVKAAGNILSTLFLSNAEMDFTNTAIVLPDETLLLPALHSIPENISKVNITMGYPITVTTVYSFLENLLELQRTVRKIHNEVRFYYPHVIDILDHPLISDIEIEKGSTIKELIMQQNLIYISPDTFKNSSFLSRLYTPADNSDQLSSYLLEITYLIMGNCEKEDASNDQLTREFLYHLYTTIKRLHDLLIDEETTLMKETYIRVLKKVVRNIRIPFTGEPLAGLQMMGILETRTLDFENLIILSVNEGILPKGTLPPSFIPYNLRKGFGLSSIDHQDSIYAYYFYRLLQRAKHVYLIYNSHTEGIKSGEMSRYLYQLKYDPLIPLQESTISYNLAIHTSPAISIEKEPDLLEKLIAYTHPSNDTSYLSPSAVNTYLDCSLRFYFTYIARLQEPTAITEDVDTPIFGKILHKAVNIIYFPFQNTSMTHDDLLQISKDKKRIENALLKAFAEEYFAKPSIRDEELHGRNLIIKDVLYKYLTQILKTDLQYSPIEILFLEKLYLSQMIIQSNGKELSIQIGGKIDRIDKTTDGIRIIDYKTGTTNMNTKQVEDLFQVSKYNRNSAILQVLYYSMLFEDNTKEIIPVVPGIYSLRSLYEKDFDYHISIDNQKITNFTTLKEKFSTLIQHTISDIFDPEHRFEQTEEIQLCKYCPYKAICNR